MHGTAGVLNAEISLTTDAEDSTICIDLPLTRPEKAALMALDSRLRRSPTGITTLAVMIVQVPDEIEVESYGRMVRSALFRSSDSIFPSIEHRELILLLEDCTNADIPHVIRRVSERAATPKAVGAACCPADAYDPEALFTEARRTVHSTFP